MVSAVFTHKYKSSQHETTRSRNYEITDVNAPVFVAAPEHHRDDDAGDESTCYRHGDDDDCCSVRTYSKVSNVHHSIRTETTKVWDAWCTHEGVSTHTRALVHTLGDKGVGRHRQRGYGPPGPKIRSFWPLKRPKNEVEPPFPPGN